MNLTLKDSTIARNRAVSPWTDLYFLQSLLINFTLGYPLSLLYNVALTCILMLLWRSALRAQKALVGICSLVAAMCLPFDQACGLPNFNTLLALYSTDMEESTEILTIFPWYSYPVGVFTSAPGVTTVHRKKDVQQCNWNKFDDICLLSSVVAFFVTPVQNLAWGGVFKLKNTGYPVFRFVKDAIVNSNEVFNEQERTAKLSNVKDSWTVTAVKPKYYTYVVVIGESTRRDTLGVFGGHWDNIPSVSSANGYIFADYIAASGSTQKSFGLTPNRVVDNKPQFQNNFITPANRAGFQTQWFSNWRQIDEYDTAIASIAKCADEVQFLENGDFEADENTRDEALLEMIVQVLATGRTQPQLIVLHLMGSHPQAYDRTQGRYETFVQSKETSCYLYTMTQTDDLLRQLCEQLHNSGNSLPMVYLSDHGLAFKERGREVQHLTHDDQFQQNFQVSSVVSPSDDKAHRVIKVRHSANDFFSFSSQWAETSVEEVTNSYRFISEKKAGPVYITNFKLQKVDYNHLGIDISSTE